MDYEKLYQERKNRVETAVDNKQPDQVPVNLGFNCNYVFRDAGMTIADTMVDHEKTCELIYNYYKEHPQYDTASASRFVTPAKVMENLGSKNFRWPGDPKGLDVNNSFQFIEYETLYADEYDEMLNHPAEFYFTKLLPRTCGVFDCLADKDYLRILTGMTGDYILAPEMVEVYRRLLNAAEENVRYMQIVGKWSDKIRGLGFYSMMGGASATAFDMLGDTLRGTFGMMPDIIERRDDVKRTIDAFCKVHIQNSLEFCKTTGCRYFWVMLHKGFDNFISDEDYKELYWPSLQKWILALVDNGITPVVYTEGAYNTRLKYLKDVPKNKVVYHFETVDIKTAKKELGDIACLMGAFPAYDVVYSNPKALDEKIKEFLDVMAPGGGYIFNTGCSCENAPKENMEAVLEALEKYGKY